MRQRWMLYTDSRLQFPSLVPPSIACFLVFFLSKFRVSSHSFHPSFLHFCTSVSSLPPLLSFFRSLISLSLSSFSLFPSYTSTLLHASLSFINFSLPSFTLSPIPTFTLSFLLSFFHVTLSFFSLIHSFPIFHSPLLSRAFTPPSQFSLPSLTPPPSQIHSLILLRSLHPFSIIPLSSSFPYSLSLPPPSSSPFIPSGLHRSPPSSSPPSRCHKKKLYTHIPGASVMFPA